MPSDKADEFFVAGVDSSVLDSQQKTKANAVLRQTASNTSARAEAAMDAMYEREHGRPPDKGRKEGEAL